MNTIIRDIELNKILDDPLSSKIFGDGCRVEEQLKKGINKHLKI